MTTASASPVPAPPARRRAARVRWTGARLHAEAALLRRGLGPVAGVDEAGRGACAGPLVVAACVLPGRLPAALDELDDSKRLRPEVRERLHDALLVHAVAHSVVVVDPARVDACGVHRCTMSAMREAVAQVHPAPGFVLVDGFGVDGFGCQSAAVIGGDAHITSIAAASVLAKVTRDRLMVEADRSHPGYGLAGHKGYPTAAHDRAITLLGPSGIHRMSYANVRRAAQAHARSKQ